MKRLAIITCILLCICGVFCLSASAAEANPTATLYDFYGDGMLFRQNEIAVFSGTGKAGDEISCMLLDDTGAEVAKGKTTVSADGTFEVEFIAPEGGYKEYTAVLYCAGNEFKRITDIVFGELWLSSGQSNMQMALFSTVDWQKIVETADYGSEWVRFLQVPFEPLISGEKTVPYYEVNNIEGAYWLKGGGANVGEVSAVSYYFANELAEKLNMPVGVLSVSLGGTPICSWIPRDALVNNDETLGILKEHGQYISEKDWYKSQRNYYTDMTGNYNAKVYPLRNFKIAGMIWYQGESEALGAPEHGEYSAYFNLLQKSYTEVFGLNKNLPIVYTHLACYSYLLNKAYLQDFNAEFTEIQQQAPSSRALTAISDVSLDFYTDSQSIHPITKEPVGKRMAESAMGMVYGESGPYTVASLKSYKIEGKYVYMTFSDVGDGLICDGTELKDFAVCGKDGVYYAAKAEIVSSDTVKVWNDEITSPEAATYAFSQGNYRANLYSTKNGEKYMPVSPSVTKRLNGAFYYYDLPWTDCEDEKFFRNASSEEYTGMYKLWNTENCTYVIDENSAFSGKAGLSVTSTKKNFGINENFAFYNGNHIISYCDVSRNWSKYGVLRFMARNTGKEDITLKNIQIKVVDGLWLAPELCGKGSESCVIPADGEWHLIEADLNKLYLSGNSKSFPLPSVTIRDIFGLYLNFEGEKGSTVEIDSFALAPKTAGNSPIYFDLISRTFNTIRTFFSAAVDIIQKYISGGYFDVSLNPTPEIYWSGTNAGAFADMTVTDKGYDIYKYPNGSSGYRYGCTYLYNDDGSVDAYFATMGKVIDEWDWISYRHSTDGGKTWGQEKIILTPTEGSKDHFSVCDPGVVYFGGYYYLAYTSTLNSEGRCNNIFVARSENPDGPFFKWNGSGWGGCNPEPIIYYNESYDKFGIGEPSFVELDGILYIYYTHLGPAGEFTMVATADSKDENWPATINFHGAATSKITDSLDVKYVDEWGKFIAVATGSRMSPDSWLALYQSNDGLHFELADVVRENTFAYLHNAGISSRPNGHISLKEDARKLCVIYAYGEGWGTWNTRVQPISLNLSWSNDFASELAKPCLNEELQTENVPFIDLKIGLIRPEKNVYTYTADTKSFRINLMGFDSYFRKLKIPVLAGAEFHVYDKSVVTINNTTFRATVKGVGTTAVEVTYKDISYLFYITITENEIGSGNGETVISAKPVSQSYTIYLAEKDIHKPQIRIARTFDDGSYREDYIEATETVITFDGYDRSIISVDEKGIITALNIGETIVTVNCEGTEFNVKVTVSENPADGYYKIL